jgi:hypothetical protein
MGGSVADAKKLPNGMLEVVLAPEMKIQTVSVSLGKFGARCAGPTDYLPKLLEMCESLTAPGAGAPAGKAAAAAPAAAPAGKAAAAPAGKAAAAAAPAGGAAAAPAKAGAKAAPAPAKKK